MTKKNTKKNIILYIANLRGGGAERVVSTLSLNMPDHIGTTVVVCNAERVFYDYKGDLVDLKPPQHLKWLYSIYPIYKLRKIKKERNIDAAISFIDGSNLRNIYSQILYDHKSKVVISVRNFPSKRKNQLRNGWIKLFYNRADLIVAVSRRIKQDLVDNFGIERDKVRVIYNPCNIERIKNLSKEKTTKKEDISIFKENCPVIVNLANFKTNGQKGQQHLIRAFKIVQDEYPDAKMIFIGRGKLENYAKRLTEELDLSSNVYFLGFQDNPFKFLAKSDIFVLSSLFEGLPNTMLEAMACDLPIVSTDCPSGPREILAPDTDFRKQLRDKIEYAEYGILTPVCDGKQYSATDPITKEEALLSKALISLLEDEQLRKKYKEKSKERIKDFEPEKIVSQWLEVINVS